MRFLLTIIIHTPHFLTIPKTHLNLNHSFPCLQLKEKTSINDKSFQ